MMIRKAALFAISLAVVASLSGCVRIAQSPYPVATATTTAGASSNCEGKSVTLNQPGTHYELTGSCDRVSIQGQDITVTLASAKTFTINGDRNNVVVKSIGGLTIEGQDNGIRASVIGTLGISGDRNSVAASALGPKTVNGQGNSVIG